jgi:hypothetical protein
MNYFYYSEDKKIFSSKIQAIQYSKQNNIKIWFNYYDDTWSKLNWSIEPTQSLEYYYKEHALSIRDNYDYVILCYSGGYDSTNILETFYYNNIKLDKIVMVGAFSQDSISGVDENHNGELYHNAYTLVEKLGLSSITETIDYTKLFNDIKRLKVYDLGEEWIHQMNGFYSPHNWFWYDLPKYVVPNNIKDKKVAIIFGKDKPKLIGNKFCFSDNPALSYAGGPDKTTNIHRINFYWDPDYPFILLKQLYKIKETRLNYPNVNLSVDDIVYNLKNPLVFKSPKSRYAIFSLRDNYLKNNKNSEIFNFYKCGIKKMEQYVNVFQLDIVHSRFYEIL